VQAASGTRPSHTPPGTPAVQSSARVSARRVTGPPRTGGAPLRRAHSWPWLSILFAVTFAGAGLAAIPKARRG
jgi:hypothetical protein